MLLDIHREEGGDIEARYKEEKIEAFIEVDNQEEGNIEVFHIKEEAATKEPSLQCMKNSQIKVLIIFRKFHFRISN